MAPQKEHRSLHWGKVLGWLSWEGEAEMAQRTKFLTNGSGHKGPSICCVYTKKKKQQKYRMWQIKQEMCMYSEIVKCCVNIRDSYALLP